MAAQPNGHQYQHGDLPAHISVGSGNRGKLTNKNWTMQQLCDRLSKVTRTKEKRDDYLKLSVDEKSDLKNAAGWWYGAQSTDGHRRASSIVERWIGVFDMDNLTPDQHDDLKLGASGLSDFWFHAHTTRSHTAEKPRLRVTVRFTRAVNRDEYSAVMRILAHRFDETLKGAARESFAWAQMMFWPTFPSDQPDWFSWENRGRLVDPDEILNSWPHDWRDATTLPHNPAEAKARNSAKKAENAESKGGVVGAFCRAYDVESAISAFDLPYVKSEKPSAKPRYTYTGGTSYDGAEIEDGGLFLYSHHATDPVSRLLVNAFDLVRIHLFGDLDENIDEEEVPMGQRPS